MSGCTVNKVGRPQIPALNRALIGAALGLLLMQSARIAMAQEAASSEPAPIAVGKATPTLRLVGLDGKEHTLAEFRKHPVILHFFCGCDECHRYARIWAQNQPGTLQPAVSLVIYLGEAEGAKKFLQETGLNPTENLILADPEFQAGLAYQALNCPRAFVLDTQGVLRFTNVEKAHSDEGEHAHTGSGEASARTILNVLNLVRKLSTDGLKPSPTSTTSHESDQEEYRCAALYR